LTEVISVRFRGGCKNYYFDPKGVQYHMGDEVVVETAQGYEFSTCTEANHEVEDTAIVKPLCAVVRMATDNDRRTVEYNRKREREAFDVCEKKIAQHGLEMKLVNVNCSFDGSKIIFFFTADGRVDFRELVRDLAGVFRARIELRQIGVRDEAKMVGGLGICGRPFCCSQFLDGFMPVSIKMAKTQSLSLNPAKISGTCGRLMCCLKYEQEAYEDASKRMPKNESFVQTPDGPGNVKSVDLLREKVKVSLDSAAPSEPLKCYHNCEVCVLRNGKGVRDGIAVPAERPARYVEEKKPEEETPITPVISTPFYMDTTAGHLENTMSSEEPASSGDDAARRRRHSRGRRGGRGGQKPITESGKKPAIEGKPKQPAAKQPEAESRRPAPRPAAADADGQAAQNAAKRRRPHHRGGRHHGHGGGEGGSAPAQPKSE
jgi:cell fate regulator YaaT (PSP1 superfamily)